MVKIRRIIYIILHHHSTPHDIAIGFASGIFAAFIPAFGLQMVLAILISMLFKDSNKLAAALATWITNPLTGIPFMLLQFWLGSLFYQDKATIDDFSQIINSFSESFSFTKLLDLGADVIIPFAIGTMILSSFGSIFSYFLAKKGIEKWRLRKGITQDK